MQNDQEPTGQWTGTPPSQPAVTISQAEYDSLRHQAAQAPPTPSPVPAAPGQQLQNIKTTASEKVWFVLAIFVLASVFIRTKWFLFFPIVAFGLAAAMGFFKDASSHSRPAKGALLVFKIIAVIGITFFIVIGAIVMFFIVAVSRSGGIGF